MLYPIQNEVRNKFDLSSFPRTTSDFFPFAGLHRPVVLYSVPQNHIEDVVVVTGIDGTDGTVRVSVGVNGVPALAMTLPRLLGAWDRRYDSLFAASRTLVH